MSFAMQEFKACDVWSVAYLSGLSCIGNNLGFPCFLRLDLVPINRSVGLKAKPTKPVTEVLRPVVAKYGLHLGDLVARIVSIIFTDLL